MADICTKYIILSWACGAGHIKIVRYLIGKYGYEAKDRCLFNSAVMHGQIEVVKFLVEKCGAHNYDNVDHDYTIRLAVGNVEVLRYLVEKCNLNPRGENDRSLKVASQYGNFESVKYLIEDCGANANEYAVQQALEYDHFEVVKYLVEKCGTIVPHNFYKYQRYVSVYNKGQTRRKYIASKKIYFWWVRVCYDPNSLCGQRSIYKGYREYLSIS